MLHAASAARRRAAARAFSSRALPLDELVSWAKTRGFVYPPPLYGGIGAAYDYGPAGAALKRNLERAWWADFVDRRADCVPLATAALLSPRVWEASGHVAQFSDPLSECAKCKRRVRADKAVGGALAAARAAAAAAAAAGAPPPPPLSPALAALGADAGGASLEALGAALVELRVRCPACGAAAGAGGLGAPASCPLLVETHVGSAAGGGARAFFRPETAQGAYIHFADVLTSTRRRLPLGVGQAGTSWRNEVDVGPFLFRTREFEQLELQYFCAPAASPAAFDMWVDFCERWLTRAAGLRADSVRRKPYARAELAHYALATTDLEFAFPHGWDELWGVANRGDFDLRAHAAASGVALTYAEPGAGGALGAPFVPHVVEPALGLSRLVFAVLYDGLREETLAGGEPRLVFRVAEDLAPVAVTVLPLVKKEPLLAAADALLARLLPHARADADTTGAIGKRYRRADEVGTPLCATVDATTLVDGTVTLRDRDSMAQVRLHVDDVVARAAARTLKPSLIAWPPRAAAPAAADAAT
jgi:glycyl-tRNA synthetase